MSDSIASPRFTTGRHAKHSKPWFDDFRERMADTFHRPGYTRAMSEDEVLEEDNRMVGDFDDEPNNRPLHRVAKWVVIAGVVILVVLAVFALFRAISASVPSANTNGTANGAASASKLTTWRLAYSDYGNNRWFANGIAEIRNAKTPADAANAAQVWLNRVKPDPNLLVAAAKSILNRDIDKTTLFKNGWATSTAVQLVAEMQLTLANAKIVPANAPQNGRNTGVDKGVVVSSVTPGIRGNRKGIKITLSNGRVFWVMARCGNIVTQGHPPFPRGKTELQPKDASKDPAARGNAPTGGGKNQDPGPGTYIPPGSMVKPPATKRVNPTPPAVVTPPTGSKPDPAPAPAPEPSAPTPTTPAKGNSPPPGKK